MIEFEGAIALAGIQLPRETGSNLTQVSASQTYSDITIKAMTQAPPTNLSATDFVRLTPSNILPWLIHNGLHDFLKPTMEFEVTVLPGQQHREDRVLDIPDTLVLRTLRRWFSRSRETAKFSQAPGSFNDEVYWITFNTPDSLPPAEPDTGSSPYGAIGSTSSGQSLLELYMWEIESTEHAQGIKLDQEFTHSISLNSEAVNILRFIDESTGESFYYFAVDPESTVKTYPYPSHSRSRPPQFGSLSVLDIRPYLQEDESGLLIQIHSGLTLIVTKSAGESNSVYEEGVGDRNLMEDLLKRVDTEMNDDEVQAWLTNPSATAYEGSVYLGYKAEVDRIINELNSDELTHERLTQLNSQTREIIKGFSRIEGTYGVVEFHNRLISLLEAGHLNPRIYNDRDFSELTEQLSALVNYQRHLLTQILLVQAYFGSQMAEVGYPLFLEKIEQLAPGPLKAVEESAMKTGLGQYLASRSSVLIENTTQLSQRNDQFVQLVADLELIALMTSDEQRQEARASIWQRLQALREVQ
ncbi:MAG: hypothetical protein HRT45_10585 [Bdellovibrionales bacterium]|nr:hypothetical protein [Bdellovibrionales bacterium]